MDADGIDRVLQEAVDRADVAGVVAGIATTAADTYLGAFGRATDDRAMAVDTVFIVASMTKAVTAVVLMQLVERGAVGLDDPAGRYVEFLRDVQVLVGFDDDDDTAILRPARGAITIRQLLTHSSGLGYDWNHELLHRYVQQRSTVPGSEASFRLPLVFDPGHGWAYGSGIDWAGRVIEEVSGERLDHYLQRYLFDPLAMNDTGFALSPTLATRSAAVYRRAGDGLKPSRFANPAVTDMISGGGGLYSTVPDYLRFTAMLLGGGMLGDCRVLAESTVDDMLRDHLGDLDATGWTTQVPAISADVSFFGGNRAGWGLSFLVNSEPTAEGRSAGSSSWAGIANTHFWIDRRRGVTGIFASQTLPFYDERVMGAFAEFERTVYGTLR